MRGVVRPMVFVAEHSRNKKRTHLARIFIQPRMRVSWFEAFLETLSLRKAFCLYVS